MAAVSRWWTFAYDTKQGNNAEGGEEILMKAILPGMRTFGVDGFVIALVVLLCPFGAAAVSYGAAVQRSSTVPAGYQLTFDDEFASLNLSDQNGTGAKWYTHTVQCCLYDSSNPSTPTYMAGVRAPAGQNPYSLVSGGLDIGSRRRMERGIPECLQRLTATAKALHSSMDISR